MKWYTAPMTLLGIVLVSATSVVLEPALNLFGERYFEDIARGVGTGGMAIVISVIVVPVVEELVFRGLLLRWLAGKWRPFWAVLLSAAVFGAVHLPNLPQGVNALACGVVLGYVYVATRSVWPVIVIHAVNNALAYLLMETLGVGATDLRTMIGADGVYWVVYGVSAAVLIGAMAAIIKKVNLRYTGRSTDE